MPRNVYSSPPTRDALADHRAACLLDAVALDQRHADDEHRDAQMRQRSSRTTPPDWRRGALKFHAGGAWRKRCTAPAIVAATIHSARNRPSATSGDQSPIVNGRSAAVTTRNNERPSQRVAQVGAIPPSRQLAIGPIPMQECGGRHENREDQIEIGRADRGLGKVQRIEEHRVQRSEEYRSPAKPPAGYCSRAAQTRARPWQSPRRRRLRPRAAQYSVSEPPIDQRQETRG